MNTTTDQAYHVGPGVLAAMEKRSDRPRSHEVYIDPNWSVTAGEQWAYLYSAQADQVYVLPKA